MCSINTGGIAPKYSATTPAPSTLHIQLAGDDHPEQPHNAESTTYFATR